VTLQFSGCRRIGRFGDFQQATRRQPPDRRRQILRWTDQGGRHQIDALGMGMPQQFQVGHIKRKASDALSLGGNAELEYFAAHFAATGPNPADVFRLNIGEGQTSREGAWRAWPSHQAGSVGAIATLDRKI
jgi:hypothetical protein